MAGWEGGGESMQFISTDMHYAFYVKIQISEANEWLATLIARG